LKNLAVIFDMDGVIADTNPHHAIAWKQFLAKYQLHPSEEDFSRHMYGKSNSYILRHFLKKDFSKEEILQLEFEKESLFREVYQPFVTPVEGLPEFINLLKINRIKIGVATSAPVQNMNLILDKLDLRKYMESLLSGEDVLHHKPDPEVYLKSAANLGVNPADCVVFEDSVSGVTAAQNAGMKVVGVLTTYTPEELPPCEAYVSDYLGISLEKTTLVPGREAALKMGDTFL
jgi:beta-phosphoglucomutase